MRLKRRYTSAPCRVFRNSRYAWRIDLTFSEVLYDNPLQRRLESLDEPCEQQGDKGQRQHGTKNQRDVEEAAGHHDEMTETSIRGDEFADERAKQREAHVELERRRHPHDR